MAHFESRQFGSKKFLLIIADTNEEAELVNAVLGKKEPIGCNGEVKRDDSFQLYIRLQSGKQATKE